MLHLVPFLFISGAQQIADIIPLWLEVLPFPPADFKGLRCLKEIRPDQIGLFLAVRHFIQMKRPFTVVPVIFGLRQGPLQIPDLPLQFLHLLPGRIIVGRVHLVVIPAQLQLQFLKAGLFGFKIRRCGLTETPQLTQIRGDLVFPALTRPGALQVFRRVGADLLRLLLKVKDAVPAPDLVLCAAVAGDVFFQNVPEFLHPVLIPVQLVLNRLQEPLFHQAPLIPAVIKKTRQA